jgi:hypothetical protein
MVLSVVDCGCTITIVAIGLARRNTGGTRIGAAAEGLLRRL